MVARLALGTAQLGDPYGIANRRGRLDEAEVDTILSAAFEQGVRCLDTAAGYGKSEAAIGSFLERQGRPDGLTICTKLPALPPALSTADVELTVDAELDGSLRRLRLDAVDVYLVHAAADLERYGPALVGALARQRDAGRISRIGVSVYGPEEAETAMAFPELSAIQFPFNVFDRRMTVGRRESRATFARSPLLQGLLALALESLPAAMIRARPWLESYRDLCRAHGASPVSTALAWAAQRSGADHVVLGVESPEQLAAAAVAFRTPLDAALVEAIERELTGVPSSILDPRQWGVPEP
jgi:aryl-alcohol dehydrogenase-like predicted oxidoreductase